jgi:hypothetical protein
MEEREASERKTDGLHKKVQELFSQLSVTLGTEYGHPSAAAFDKLISRVSGFCLNRKDNEVSFS